MSKTKYFKVASSRLSGSRTFKDFQTVYFSDSYVLTYCDLWPKQLKIESYKSTACDFLVDKI